MKDSLSLLISKRTASDGAEGGDSTISMFLSLYLILFGFFIVLNSFAEPKASLSEEALKSVNETFKAGKTNLQGEKDDVKAFPAASQDPFLRAVDDVFSNELNLKGRFATHRGNILELEVPVSRFFEPGSLSLSPDKEASLRALMQPLLSDKDGQKQLMVLFSVDAATIAVKEERGDQFLVMRSASFHQSLQALGLSDAVYSIGLIEGRPDEMMFVFQHKAPKASLSTAAILSKKTEGQ